MNWDGQTSSYQSLTYGSHGSGVWHNYFASLIRRNGTGGIFYFNNQGVHYYSGYNSTDWRGGSVSNTYAARAVIVNGEGL